MLFCGALFTSRNIRIFFAALLTLLASNGILAQPIAFRGGLPTELQELYENLEAINADPGGQGLAEARLLFNQSREFSDEMNAWAGLVYAEYLMENDSTATARQILSDHRVRWLEAQQGWLGTYYSLLKARLKFRNGDFLEADQILEKISSNSQSKLQFKIFRARSLCLLKLGRLNESISKWYLAEKAAEVLSDSTLLVECYLGRVRVRLRSGDLAKALEEVQTVVAFADRNNFKLLKASSLSLFSLIETYRDNSQQGLDLALKSYQIFMELNRSNGKADAQLSSAMAYQASENWSQALRYFEDALQLKIRSNDLSEATSIWIQIAQCHLELGDKELAEKFYDQALKKALATGQVLVRADAVEGLSSVYYEDGRYRQAYETQKTLLALKDSLDETERKAEVTELEVQFETAKKEQEITVLQQERAIITNRWLTLALGLFLTIIIGVLVYDNQKRKHRQEKELLSTEDELRKAELKIMTDVLAHNQQRLSAYTENLLNKNNLVTQLERKLNEVVESARTDSSTANELMVDFTNVRILTDDDWQEFKELFDGVHRGLREKLNAKYQNLTLAEQRLFLLMKLDMSTKEIANILGVSPESVKKARYRLKKKLTLNEDISLQDFISSF